MKMHSTLQRRLAACEEDRAAAEKAKLEREASAQKILTEQQLSLEAATKRFSWLEQQAQVNAKVTKRSYIETPSYTFIRSAVYCLSHYT
jgi:hypothetical protein